MAVENNRADAIPNPAVRRLSFYLRQLEIYQKKGRRTISSKQLGVVLGYTDAQVRKDFAYFGQFGHPGVGYRVDDLILRIRQILGTDKKWDVILFGAGNLGRALLAYKGFESKGFRTVAVFDADPEKVGTMVGEYEIRPAVSAAKFIRENNIRLAILAVPAEVAQDVADELVNAGIQGILNFAPVALIAPPNVGLISLDVAVQLEQLSFQVGFSDATASARQATRREQGE